MKNKYRESNTNKDNLSTLFSLDNCDGLLRDWDLCASVGSSGMTMWVCFIPYAGKEQTSQLEKLRCSIVGSVWKGEVMVGAVLL